MTPLTSSLKPPWFKGITTNLDCAIFLPMSRFFSLSFYPWGPAISRGLEQGTEIPKIAITNLSRPPPMKTTYRLLCMGPWSTTHSRESRLRRPFVLKLQRCFTGHICSPHINDVAVARVVVAVPPTLRACDVQPLFDRPQSSRPTFDTPVRRTSQLTVPVAERPSFRTRKDPGPIRSAIHYCVTRITRFAQGDGRTDYMRITRQLLAVVPNPTCVGLTPVRCWSNFAIYSNPRARAEPGAPTENPEPAILRKAQ